MFTNTNKNTNTHMNTNANAKILKDNICTKVNCNCILYPFKIPQTNMQNSVNIQSENSMKSNKSFKKISPFYMTK